MQCMRTMGALGRSIMTMPGRAASIQRINAHAAVLQGSVPGLDICSTQNNSLFRSFSVLMTRNPVVTSARSQILNQFNQRNNVNENFNVLPRTLGNVNLITPRRSVVRFSALNGKRKTVKAVIKRFYRLNWGIWIRPRAGRHKKLWKKNAARRKRARTHVFCNATQTYMLDKMVAKFWRKKTYYVDDPYESYHKRENFWITSKR